MKKLFGFVCIITLFTLCTTAPEKEAADYPVQFSQDEATLALYHFTESGDPVLTDQTATWHGRVGTAMQGEGHLVVANGEKALFDTIIPTGLKAGTIELYFKLPDSDNLQNTFTLLGNEGARCNLLVKKDTLYFVKNYTNNPKTVKGPITIKPATWHHVAGTWGPKGMRLFFDDTRIAFTNDTSGYQCSPRATSTDENVFCAGQKSSVGLEKIGVRVALFFTGEIDEVCFSSSERY